jgi:hypothetical protein
MNDHTTAYVGQIRYRDGGWIDVSLGDTKTEAAEAAADAFRTARDADGNVPDGVRVIPRCQAVHAAAPPND